MSYATNAERRRQFAATLVGKTVEVVAANAVIPHEDPSVLVHLPLPEYGIALLVRTPAAPTPPAAPPDPPDWADQSDNDACRDCTDDILGEGSYDGYDPDDD